MPAPSTPSFVELDRVHEAIMEELQLHQDAVVQSDLPTARRHLDRLTLMLKAHIRAEDEVLLPIYAERVPPQIGCTPELLFDEHRKLERLLKKTQERMLVFEAAGEIRPRERVYMIEEERMLKEVLDHHDRRERAVFFPKLDECIQGEERQRVWEECAAIQDV
jgi:hemerythrin-like domain-containing protein